jgi:hypothetical protein
MACGVDGVIPGNDGPGVPMLTVDSRSLLNDRPDAECNFENDKEPPIHHMAITPLRLAVKVLSSVVAQQSRGLT